MTAAPRRTVLVSRFVDERVRGLQHGYLHVPQRAGSGAALTRLRRAAGKEPGEVMDALEYTFTPGLRYGHPEDDPGPSPAERAAHVAITLFALHQHGVVERMHHRGRGLGTALRRLHPGRGEVPAPIRTRIKMLTVADSWPNLTRHLTDSVRLLRAHKEPLDYGLLAHHLLAWQDNPARVRLTWGRQFHRQNRADKDIDTDVDRDSEMDSDG